MADSSVASASAFALLARGFFAQRTPESPAHISIVVVAEFVWLLTKKYKFSFDRVGAVIRQILDSDDFTIERPDLVERALDRFTRSRIDFADLIIAEADRDAGCEMTVTFDRNAARRVPGMELLK